MRSILDEFRSELDELKTLVASIDPVNTALAAMEESIVRQYLTIRRRFDYAAFVVALYASYEKFAESLVAAFVQVIADRTEYAALPPALVSKHLTKSAEILFRGRLGETGRYAGVTSAEMVRNLFSCISGARPYTLNSVAVVAHEANLRHGEMVKLFVDVGIENFSSRLQRSAILIGWYETSSGGTLIDEAFPVETVEQKIVDLVERRNRVAHRGGSPDDLLGSSDMLDFLAFFEALAAAAFSIVAADYLKRCRVDRNETFRLDLLEGPYVQGFVVVVRRPTATLYVGQPVFSFVSRGGGVKWGRIVEIQLNDVSVASTENSTSDEVGLKVNFECPRDVQLHVLQTDDELIWEPLPV